MPASRGAVGDVDLSFNAESGVSGSVYAATPLADGKVLISGEFNNVGNAVRPGIARLNADGSLDESFNPSQLKNTTVLAHVVTSGGNVVVGGYNAAYQGWISRLNADGTIDTSFTPPSVLGQRVTKLLLQPDGKIVVGGLFSKIGGAAGDLIIRLNTDGAVDSNFKATAFANFYSDVEGLKLQPDGKVLVSAGGPPIRLITDGSVDTSFAAPQFDYASVSSIALQPDGKILVGGLVRFAPSQELYNVVRLHADGSADTNFPPLQRNYLNVPAIEFDKDGRTLIAGSSYEIAEIIRLNVHGTNDLSFVPPIGATTEIQSIVVDPSGNIIVAGAFTWPRGIANVARLSQGGALDVSFQPGFSLTGVVVSTVAVDSENRPIGALAAYGRGVAVQRFNLDGSVDTNFAMTSLRGEPTVLTLQNDGKILVASRYTLDTWLASDFKRLNPDGTADPSFKFRGANKVINATFPLPDGKILIAGAFTTLNGLAADRIARLNADGTIDHTFHSLAFFGSPAVDDDIARSLAIQPDGKILVGFELHACSCDHAKPVAVLRLNSDGSFDPTFDSSEIVPLWAGSLLVEADGKILVGGFQFGQRAPSATQHGIVRLNANGSLDPTFTTPLPTGSNVRAIAIDAAGKIVLNSNSEVMRLNPNGTLDTMFKTASADDGGQYATDFALAPDGNIYFCGPFNSVNRASRPRLVRIFGTPVSIPLSITRRGDGLIFNWSNSTMRLQSAASVDGPFTDVADSNSLRMSPDQSQRYFRLRAE